MSKVFVERLGQMTPPPSFLLTSIFLLFGGSGNHNFFHNRSRTPQDVEIGGTLIVMVSIAFLGIVARRFEWIESFLWWSYDNWSFPASRLAATLGGIIGLTIGVAVVNASQDYIVPRHFFISSY
jgi:hypothetical protein